MQPALGTSGKDPDGTSLAVPYGISSFFWIRLAAHHGMADYFQCGKIQPTGCRHFALPLSHVGITVLVHPANPRRAMPGHVASHDRCRNHWTMERYTRHCRHSSMISTPIIPSRFDRRRSKCNTPYNRRHTHHGRARNSWQSETSGCLFRPNPSEPLNFSAIIPG